MPWQVSGALAEAREAQAAGAASLRCSAFVFVPWWEEQAAASTQKTALVLVLES
jgi:hypothetical protein